MSAPIVAADHALDGKFHILLTATGSVATIKLPLIARALLSGREDKVAVRIAVTTSASKFLVGQSDEQPHLLNLLGIPGVEAIYTDADEWEKPWVRGDPILHIELRRWADIMIIAPLSANSMAKMVNGISDNLVLSVARAWDTEGKIDGAIKFPGETEKERKKKEKKRKKKIFIAPAMNTAMWKHPTTRKHMEELEIWQYHGFLSILYPTSSNLACGDVGEGAMLEWRQIVKRVEMYLELNTQ